MDRGLGGALVFGGGEEMDLAEEVARGIGSNALPVAGLSLREMMGLMARCGLFITNDSGPMHLATALSVPVVAIFGPTHPVLGFWPLGKRDRVLTADLECSPCSLHGSRRCPREWICLREVTVDQVVQTAEQIMGERS